MNCLDVRIDRIGENDRIGRVAMFMGGLAARTDRIPSPDQFDGDVVFHRLETVRYPDRFHPLRVYLPFGLERPFPVWSELVTVDLPDLLLHGPVSGLVFGLGIHGTIHPSRDTDEKAKVERPELLEMSGHSVTISFMSSSNTGLPEERM